MSSGEEIGEDLGCESGSEVLMKASADGLTIGGKPRPQVVSSSNRSSRSSSFVLSESVEEQRWGVIGATSSSEVGRERGASTLTEVVGTMGVDGDISGSCGVVR